MAIKSKSKDLRFDVAPSQVKLPRARNFPTENVHLQVKVEKMDFDGRWGWVTFKPVHLQKLLARLLECQKLTWQELRGSGSHCVSLNLITNDARKRLEFLQCDDIEELYSLRLTSKERIWGIKDGAIFWLLWWDPNHEICPCDKKNT